MAGTVVGVAAAAVAAAIALAGHVMGGPSLPQPEPWAPSGAPSRCRSPTSAT